MELDKKIIRLSVSAADKQIIEDCYSKIFDNQEDGTLQYSEAV